MTIRIYWPATGVTRCWANLKQSTINSLITQMSDLQDTMGDTRPQITVTKD